MTTKQSNRLWATDDYAHIRWDAICAAQFPNGYEHNPHELGSKDWHAWVREFNREVQRLADLETARQAIAAGQITAAQDNLDMAERQPSMWQRAIAFAAWVFRKPAIGDA